MEIFNSLSNATNPGLSHQNIQNLNNQLQQNILNNLLLLKQEQNILNFNVMDYQMTQNINQLLQNNFIIQGTNSKSDLENQLSTLKHLLDCTFLKLDHVKKNDDPLAVSGGSLNMEASQNIYIKNGANTGTYPRFNANRVLSWTSMHKVIHRRMKKSSLQ